MSEHTGSLKEQRKKLTCQKAQGLYIVYGIQGNIAVLEVSLRTFKVVKPYNII